jgi:hypothetical protein
MEAIDLDEARYASLAIDIHHIFPQKWCNDNGIDDEHRESIVNKTAISARTNRTIGGVAPSIYLEAIQKKAQISADHLYTLLDTHLVPAQELRADDFDAFFTKRREDLCRLVEKAMGKAVPRDVDQGTSGEDSSQFEKSEMEELLIDGE